MKNARENRPAGIDTWKPPHRVAGSSDDPLLQSPLAHKPYPGTQSFWISFDTENQRYQVFEKNWVFDRRANDQNKQIGQSNHNCEETHMRKVWKNFKIIPTIKYP